MITQGFDEPFLKFSGSGVDGRREGFSGEGFLL